MTRPVYETEQNRRDEAAIFARLFLSHPDWAARDLNLLNAYYRGRLDRYIFDKRTRRGIAWAEAKRRDHEYGAFNTIILGVGKWSNGLYFAWTTGVPFWLVVAYNDGDYLYEHHADNRADLGCYDGGRTVDQRDPADVEPVMHIPIKFLKRLGTG